MEVLEKPEDLFYKETMCLTPSPTMKKPNAQDKTKFENNPEIQKGCQRDSGHK